MAVSEAKIAVVPPKCNDVFKMGKFETTTKHVKKWDASGPPTEIFVVARSQRALVAPKFYGFISFLWTSISKEVEIATKVMQWISSAKGLPLVLPQKVSPDLNNLALSGHSRGGKSAFALTLASYTGPSGILDNNTPTAKFKALIGVDPSAGSAVQLRPKPKILKYIPRSFNMSIPVAIIGSGYSNQSQWLCPPFAANGCNHSEFFNESKPPACYFLAKDYGHCDMLDDGIAFWLRFICKSGKGCKKLMRSCVGGIVVAFLKAYLGDGNEEDLNGIVNEPSIAPITLDPVVYVKE
ncbi:hypothetical protein BUALT_Bualt02G0186500 [Buddleja alternifolia]|uniref:Chlorophyllase n=1 Tax=Buddleja alternifolia TaxID=168488 RepID=A0AAV6YCD6_9LAMI|nr:hypothetical protein BUALT_Bualt02G0186500 [Buddleja alternifolia]